MRLPWVCRGLALGLTFSLFSPGSARAACRTETCQLPANFSPQQGTCTPIGATCTMPDGAVYKNLLVYWRNECVGYSVQQDASVNVTLSDFESAAAGAFATWTSTMCGANPVGIAVHYLGPVACADTTWRGGGPNQHQIVFRDAVWPHGIPGEASPTVALTTVTYNVDDGELYDATIELNSADHTIVVASTSAKDASVLPQNAYDLQSVLTHEAGHFLGLAHTPDTSAVMFASRDEGVSGLLRALAPDDIAGICSAYPGDGTRVVSTAAFDGGILNATSCDTSVVGGFNSACTAPPSPHKGCAVAAVGAADAPQLGLIAGAISALLLGFGSRRRRQP